MRAALLIVSMTGVAWSSPDPVDKAAMPRLVGTWRVQGCATSPRDPADCARGTITFDSKRWSVQLSCCKRASAYRVVSTAVDRIEIESAGVRSVIRVDADGSAHWTPGGLGGRVGELSFVRAP